MGTNLKEKHYEGATSIFEQDKDFEKAPEVRKEKSLRLDLACGNNKKKGFVGIDISKNTHADVFVDLEKYPWPWRSGEIFELYCSHYLEHVTDIKEFMEECYRILKDKAIMEIIVPYYSSVWAVQDFTHKRVLSEESFNYFSQNWLATYGLKHYDVNCNFSIESIKFNYFPEWNSRSEEAKGYAKKHYINVVKEMEIVLRKISMRK